MAGQATAITPDLTGYENLEMAGRLYHLGKTDVPRRADELLERLDLTDAARRPAKTYSGGMLRRLDLAASLIGQPRVLFLDEPTTGLDPVGRVGMWAIIRELVTGGDDPFALTRSTWTKRTSLADDIIVIDHGLVIASGTSEELKDRIGGDVVEFSVTDRAKPGSRRRGCRRPRRGRADRGYEERRVQVRAGGRGSQVLVEVVRRP